MASLKDMRVRIASTKATQKITKAMQMVAASKLRRAQGAAEAARPYAEKMGAVISSIASAAAGSPGAPAMLAGTGKDQVHLLVVATSDRGLAGGFNATILREARRQIRALKQFFVGRRCTVIMIDDRTSEGPDPQLHSLAHGVIALDSSTPAYGQVRREMQVLKFRGSDFISGFHDFTIRQGGLIVYPRLVAARHSSSFQRGFLPSGVTALDRLMGGGIDRGTSTLLIGPPGSGKSTLALQYATAAIERGDHTATFVFDETKSALLARSVGIGMHINEGAGAGEISVHQIDPVAISPGEFAHLVRYSVERDRARVVIIDSLNGYLNAMPQNNYLTAQLHELLSYLNNQGVATFFTVAQSGIMGANMTSPVDASYLADSVVLLRYFELAGRVRKAISVLKKRTGGHEGSIRELWFDTRGIHLSEPLLQLRGVLAGGPIEVVPASEGDGHVQPGGHAG